MANELRYTLDTSKESYAVQKCKQIDDRTVIIKLLSNGQPFNVSGASITLNASKPYGTWVKQTTGITIASNIVTIALSRDITRVPGEVNLELLIVLASKNTTTFTFKLQVQESVISNGDLQSSSSITEIERFNNTVSNATNQVRDLISNLNNVKNILEEDISRGNTSQMRWDIDAVTNSITNPNLIQNGGFENGAKFNYWNYSEWRNSGKVQLGWNFNNNTTNNYIIGNYTPYMRAISGANLDVGGVIGSTFIKVKPNTRYTLSYYRALFRGKATHEHAFYSSDKNLGYILNSAEVLLVKDEANRIKVGSVWEDIGNANEINTNGSMWKKVVITTDTPTDCNFIKLNFALQYSYADAFFFLDNIKLEEGELDTPYIEGMQQIIDDTLTTNNKYIVGAINEIDGQLGDVSTLTTTAKTGVGAINELDAQIGNVAGMTTTNKVVANAINELNTKVSLIAGGSNGTGFWFKYPDGTIVQYGRVAGYKAGQEYDVTFPLAFPNKCYYVGSEIISRDDSSLAYTEYINVRTSNSDKTKLHLKTGATMAGAEAMAFNIGWVAIGR